MRFLKRLRSPRHPRPSGTRPGTLIPALGSLLTLLGATAFPAGLSGQGINSPHSDAFLVSEVSAIQPGAPFTVAVRFEMDSGWHNYYVNVGDTGLPTEIDWILPNGFEAGRIQWPVPNQYRSGPLLDYVYPDGLALMVEITPPPDLTAGRSVTLEALVTWLICEDLCDPDFAEISLELPVTGGTPQPDPQWVGLFREARGRLPKAVPEWTAQAEATQNGYRLTVQPSEGSTAPPDSVYFFSSRGSVVEPSAPQAMALEGGSLTVDMVNSAYTSGIASRLTGILKAEDGRKLERQ